MTESITASIKSISGGNIYLSGYACGNAGKWYCVIGSGDTNVPNKLRGYTFFSGHGCINLGNEGCYIVDQGYSVYFIRLYEVTEYGCEHRLRLVDSTTFEIEHMCNIEIRPVDQDNMQVDATVKMVVFETGRTETKRTYDALGVYFDIEQGYSYKITATSDKCETVVQSFMVPRQDSYWEIVHMDCDVKPPLAVVACYTARTDGLKEAGVDVTVIVVGGKTETKQTNSEGIVTFGLLHGDNYTITLTPPNRCNCECWDCLCVVSDIADKDRTRDYPLRYEFDGGNGNGVDCVGKTKTECDADSNCYWWTSDDSCHDTPEPTTYPTMKITSDLDAFSGVDAYVDRTKRGVTPITVSFTESDIGKTVIVSGTFAEVMWTKDKTITLKAGINEIELELLMDNKEILAGGTIATALLINYGM